METVELELSLDDVTVDNELNPRAGALDQAAIVEYAAHIDDLPLMHCFEIDDRYYLTRGFHRYAAHQLVGVNEAFFVVHSGSYDEAQEDADLDNLRHGLRLTRLEKRAVIGRYLVRHPERSDVWVARDCYTTDKTVRSVREELEAASKIPRLDKLIGRDGIERPRAAPRPQHDAMAEAEKQTPPLPPAPDTGPEWLEPGPVPSPVVESVASAVPKAEPMSGPPPPAPGPPPLPPPIVNQIQIPLSVELTIRNGTALVSARRGDAQLSMQSVDSGRAGEIVQNFIDQYGGQNGDAV